MYIVTYETALCWPGFDADLMTVRHERDALDQKVTSLQRQIELLENSKRRTEQHSTKLSEQLNELSEKLVTRSAEFKSSPGLPQC